MKCVFGGIALMLGRDAWRGEDNGRALGWGDRASFALFSLFPGEPRESPEWFAAAQDTFVAAMVLIALSQMVDGGTEAGRSLKEKVRGKPGGGGGGSSGKLAAPFAFDQTTFQGGGLFHLIFCASDRRIPGGPEAFVQLTIGWGKRRLGAICEWQLDEAEALAESDPASAEELKAVGADVPPPQLVDAVAFWRATVRGWVPRVG